MGTKLFPSFAHFAWPTPSVAVVYYSFANPVENVATNCVGGIQQFDIL
jgi:hypothetical protein